MGMDFVGIAQLSRVDTFKFPHFRGIPTLHSEGPGRPEPRGPEALAQQPPAHPGTAPPISVRKGAKYQGEKMKQRTSHLIKVPISASLSPPTCTLLLSSFGLLCPPFSFIHLSTLSASSLGFSFCSLIFLFPYSYPLWCV